MTGPSRGILKAPRGRISLKNIWMIILQNIRAASYVTVGMLKTVRRAKNYGHEEKVVVTRDVWSGIVGERRVSTRPNSTAGGIHAELAIIIPYYDILLACVYCTYVRQRK